MSQQPRSTFVLVHPSEILAALVGLKDVAVVCLERRGPDVELIIEQVVGEVRCPGCAGPAQVKERPVVRYVDLPVYGVPMSLAWKKHRMRCVNPRCEKRSWGTIEPIPGVTVHIVQVLTIETGQIVALEEYVAAQSVTSEPLL